MILSFFYSLRLGFSLNLVLATVLLLYCYFWYENSLRSLIKSSIWNITNKMFVSFDATPVLVILYILFDIISGNPFKFLLVFLIYKYVKLKFYGLNLNFNVKVRVSRRYAIFRLFLLQVPKEGLSMKKLNFVARM